MKAQLRTLSIFAFGAVSALIGCSSANTFVAPGGTARQAVTASPTASASSVPGSASPTPTAAPTPTPTAIGTGPIGSTACTAPTYYAGTYTFIDSGGVVSGNTYVEQGGDWGVLVYPSPSPTPTPSPTGPSPYPSVDLPVPTPSGMVTEYYGVYQVPAYTGHTSYSGAYSTQATIGCFSLQLVQNVGGTAGQNRVRRADASPAPTPSQNAYGYGGPTDPDGTEAAYIDNGPMTGLTITNLTPTSGDGTFSFTDSDGNVVIGTLTITGSETQDNVSDFRRHIPAFASRLRRR